MFKIWSCTRLPKSISVSREVISVHDTLLFFFPYLYLVEPNSHQQIAGSVPTERRATFQRYMQALDSLDMASKTLWILVFLWNDFQWDTVLRIILVGFLVRTMSTLPIKFFNWGVWCRSNRVSKAHVSLPISPLCLAFIDCRMAR